jgi:hypothetical protein
MGDADFMGVCLPVQELRPVGGEALRQCIVEKRLGWNEWRLNDPRTFGTEGNQQPT